MRALKFEIPVEIRSVDVNERSGEKGGRQWKIREQHAWVHLGKAYPSEIVLKLEDNQKPYEPGEYYIDSRALYIDRYGQLQLGRLKLTTATPPATHNLRTA